MALLNATSPLRKRQGILSIKRLLLLMALLQMLTGHVAAQDDVGEDLGQEDAVAKHDKKIPTGVETPITPNNLP